MNIIVFARNYLLMLLALTVTVGVGGALILHYAFPGYYFSTYPFIPVYFGAFSSVAIYYFGRINRQTRNNRSLMLYAFIRMMKLLVSVVVVVIFGLLFRSQVKEFLFTFLAYYLLYMIFEVSVYYHFEESLKKKKEAIK